MEGAHVLEAAAACQALLGAAADRDWARRIALPGLPRQDRWAWHCAPLEEWDGLNPADRR